MTVEPQSPQAPIHSPVFHGQVGEYYRIWIVNTLLTIFTLGIYSAWAKVRTLKFMYGSTELAGSRFDFHGSPIAILKGRCIAAVVGLLYFFGASLHPLVGVFGILVIFLALPWLIVKSFQFRLAYTSYRNIRFSFRGNIKEGYKIWFRFVSIPAALMAISALYVYVSGAGATNSEASSEALMELLPVLIIAVINIIYGFIIFPRFYTSVINFLYNNAYYGGSRASLDADAKSFSKNVFMPYVFMIIGTVVIATVLILVSASLISVLGAFMGIFTAIGVIALYFGIAASALYLTYSIICYTWNRLKIDAHPTSARLVYVDYLKLCILNILAVGFTFGILYPWAKIRYQKYVIEKRGIQIESLDHFVSEAEQKISSLGEEMSSAFDIDIEIGL
jgi:uncharacterized membrane protein YjgN (DUF898 family)